LMGTIIPRGPRVDLDLLMILRVWTRSIFS